MNGPHLTTTLVPTLTGRGVGAATPSASIMEPVFITVDTQLHSCGSGRDPLNSPSNGLFCGDCSVGLESSTAFFNHWLSLHCQPLSTHLATQGGQQAEGRPGHLHGDQLVMQRCATCNHIFVEGTERCTQHAVKGCYQPPPALIQVDHKGRKRKAITVASPSGLAKKTADSLLTGSKRCVCGVCHAPVKSVSSYFLHWLEQHQSQLATPCH